MISEPNTAAQVNTLSALDFQSIFQGGPDVNGNGTGEIPYEKLKIGKKLGSGGFKDCFAGDYLGVRILVPLFYSFISSYTDEKWGSHRNR